MNDEIRKTNTGSGGEGIVERELKPISGMGMLFLLILGVLASIALVAAGFAVFEGGLTIIAVIVGIVLFVVFLVLMAGLKIVRPNEALVLTLFGKYHGTIKKEGFFYVNPFVFYMHYYYTGRHRQRTQNCGSLSLMLGKSCY